MSGSTTLHWSIAIVVDHNRERQHRTVTLIAIVSGSTALRWSIAIMSGSTLYQLPMRQQGATTAMSTY